MRFKSRHDSPNEHGFTLIELIVAFMIVSLLVVAVFSGMSVALSSWTRGNDRLEQLRDGQISTDLLIEQIRSALPLLMDPDQITASVAFAGTENQLQFVSTLSLPDGQSATPRWVKLEWIPESGASGSEGNTGHLSLTEHRILPPLNRPEALPYWSTQLLEAQSVEFSYLLGSIGAQPAQWLSSWELPTRTILPDAVALSVTTLDGSGSAVREIIIPLDINQFAVAGVFLR